MMDRVNYQRKLKRKASQGFRGFPLATIAYYGPTNQSASKVAVGIIFRQNSEPEIMKRWFSDDSDIQRDPGINKEIEQFLRTQQVKSVVIADRIMGCPHEEGIDYPEGEYCPHCSFWANRDRFTHEMCISSDDVEHIFRRIFSLHTHWVIILEALFLDAGDHYILGEIVSTTLATHPP